MAMLITKFHKLIKNRLIWLGFLVVIIFSFVIWGTQMPDARDQGPNAAGSLSGEDISFEEFQRARFNTYLSLVLMTGRAIAITPEIEDQLHEMAWQRIATLREAKNLGISSSNDEVVSAIQSFEFLQQNERFSPQAYDQFAQQFLAQFRATKREFEEHVRQEIILQKLRTVLDRMMLVTPMEVDRTFSTLTDTFEIQYVQIDPDLVADGVVVSEDDILAFFDKDREMFTLPEKVAVKAAVFPVADFREAVTITDEEIEEYYDFNLDRYALPSEAEDTNLFSLAATEYRPLEDVRDEIVDILSARQALILAQDKANQFVQELSFQRNAGRAAFDRVASEEGVELVITAPFGLRDLPSELEEANPLLVRAAFNLSDDDDYYYSDPIAGTNFVYVLALRERLPERIPEFEEVRALVERAAREFAIYNALSEKAAEIRDSVIAGLSAGLTFDEVMAEYKLTAVSPPPFDLNTVELDPEIANVLIRHLLTRNAGELTDVIEMENSMLLGYIKSRQANTEVSAEMMRPQIVGTLRRQISPITFTEMQNYLLRQAEFQDNMRRRGPVTATDDDDTDA